MKKLSKEMHTRAEEIAYKAIAGKISKSELAIAETKIKSNSPEDLDDMPQWIHAVGWAGASENRKEVEKFLYYSLNPWATKEALNVLCHWGYTADYLKEIEEFLHGVDWDFADILRFTAMRRAGEFLKEHDHKDLLQLLLDLFENPENFESLHKCVDRWPRLQMEAYNAIACAIGKEWEELSEELELYTWIIEGRPEQPAMTIIIREAHKRLHLS